MLGVAARISRTGTSVTKEEIARSYDLLLGNDAFKRAVFTGTATEDRVRIRRTLAIEAFASAS